jgi:hypothetical protein
MARWPDCAVEPVYDMDVAEAERCHPSQQASGPAPSLFGAVGGDPGSELRRNDW